MDKLCNEIYELFIKHKDVEYSMSDIDTQIIKCECDLKFELSVEDLKLFEKYEYLLKLQKINSDLSLIKFAINYLSDKK